MASGVGFAVSLYAQLALAGNAFVSPLSVQLLLLLALGASTPLSSTHRQLWAALYPDTPLPANATLPLALLAEQQLHNASADAFRSLLADAGGSTVRLSIASGIWARNITLRKEYVASMQQLYQATAQTVASAAPINAWAAKHTNGLVSRVVPPDMRFDVLLTNAIHFKAPWAYAFDKAATTAQPFKVPLGNSSKVVSVDMMYKTFTSRTISNPDRNVFYAEASGQFRAVRLPYKGTRLSAIAVLPASSRYGLDARAAAAAIRADTLLASRAWMPLQRIGQLKLQLPRFSVRTSEVALTQAIKALNISSAFSPAEADFGRLSNKPTYISDIMQSSVVTVNEEGSEAAAASATVLTMTAHVPAATPPLVFNRPFMWLIVDDANSVVLFQGIVSDPSRTS